MINDVLQVRVVCTNSNQTSINVFNYRVGSEAGAGATMQEIADRFDFKLGTPFKGVMAPAATYYGVGVRRIDPLPLGLESAASAERGAGTRTGDLLPKQTAGLLRFRGPFSGRRFMGRMYLPFPSEFDNDANGVPLANYGIQALLIGSELTSNLAVVGAGGTSVLNPVIWHRSTRTTDNILTHSWIAAWATQRRRGFFGRANVPPF